MRELIFNFDFKQLFEKITQQIALLADVVTSKLSQILGPLLQKILENPVPAGIALLALAGIPIVFFKIKDSKSEKETEGRLDQLMEEMKDFEIKTPMGDSQNDFQDTSFKDPEPLHEENSNFMDFELNNGREKLESDSMIELPSLFSEDETEEKEDPLFPEEWQTDDDLPSEDSIANQFQLNDRNFDPENLTEQDTDWFRINSRTLSDYDDPDMSLEEIDNLKREMEESFKKLTEESSESQEEEPSPEIPFGSVSQVSESTDSISLDEKIEEAIPSPEKETPHRDTEIAKPPEPLVSEKPEENHEPSDAEEVLLLPAQETFEKQLQPAASLSETPMKEAQTAPAAVALKPAVKPQVIPNNNGTKPAGNNYRDVLESFILMKNQKR